MSECGVVFVETTGLLIPRRTSLDPAGDMSETAPTRSLDEIDLGALRVSGELHPHHTTHLNTPEEPHLSSPCTVLTCVAKCDTVVERVL